MNLSVNTTPDLFSQLRSNLGNLENGISQLQPFRSTTSTNTSQQTSQQIPQIPQQTPQQPNNMTPSQQAELIGQSLGRVNSLFQQLGPHITVMSQMLQQESSLTDTPNRQEVQRLSNQLGGIFHQLGHVILTVGTSLNSLRMNESPGTVTVPPPARPVLASATLANMATGFIPQGNDGRPLIPAAQLRVPLFTVAPVSPNNSNNNLPSNNDQPGTGPQPTRPPSTPSTPNPNAPNIPPNPIVGPPPPLAAFMNHLFSSVAQSMSPPNQTSQTSQSSQSPNSPPDFNSMMNQLLGGIQSLSPSQPPTSSPVSNTTPSQPSDQNSMSTVFDSMAQMSVSSSTSEEGYLFFSNLSWTNYFNYE